MRVIKQLYRRGDAAWICGTVLSDRQGWYEPFQSEANYQVT